MAWITPHGARQLDPGSTGLQHAQQAGEGGLIGATGSGNAGSGAPTASLVTTRNNSWIFGVGNDWDSIFAIVATGGTTNFGIVDNLTSVVAAAKKHDVWVHVDGAYGIAGLFAPTTKSFFAGIEGVDSFIVDPHKWLYAPYDSCALVYRNPAIARAAHTQHASYLDVLTDTDEWNPSDYAVHLSRRARGLPLWFSLATHGVAAYREAIESNNIVARNIADVIRESDHLELVRDPMLSVVVFRRKGWTAEQYNAWSDALWESGKAACFPSKFKGEPVLRFAIVNPRTTIDILLELVESLKD